MLQFSKRDYYSDEYWNDVFQFLNSNHFLQEDNQAHVIKVQILERADLCLIDERRKVDRDLIFQSLYFSVDSYSQYFFGHLFATMSHFPYAGILDFSCSDVCCFWKSLQQKYEYSTIDGDRKISVYCDFLLKNQELPHKLHQLHLITQSMIENEQEKSIEEIVSSLEQSYHYMGLDSPYAAPLFEIGLLYETDEYKYSPARIDERIKKYWILEKNAQKLSRTLMTGNILSKILHSPKKFYYQRKKQNIIDSIHK